MTKAGIVDLARTLGLDTVLTIPATTLRRNGRPCGGVTRVCCEREGFREAGARTHDGTDPAPRFFVYRAMSAMDSDSLYLRYLQQRCRKLLDTVD